MADFAIWATACENRVLVRYFVRFTTQIAGPQIDDVVHADPAASCVQEIHGHAEQLDWQRYRPSARRRRSHR